MSNANEFQKRCRMALKPFADVGSWLFATDEPDTAPAVTFDGMNGHKIILTRGHFKEAHSALFAAENYFPSEKDGVGKLVQSGKRGILDFLERISGAGYGGMADFEIALNAARDLATNEYGWVIERGDSPASEPKYWAAGQTDASRLSAWTSNPEHAIRFARKLDARRVHDRIMKGIEVRIAEHVWPVRDHNLYGSGVNAPEPRG